MLELSRRDVLRGAAMAVAAAACAPKKGGAPANPDALAIASWPLYIDVDEKTKKRPSIEQFQRETGVSVRYREIIDDSESFLGTIRPALAAGKPTGWDLAILAETTVAKMIRLGYLEPLQIARIPNFTANAGPLAKDAPYDPGNAHSVPWQGGITGIAYNPKLTGREVDSFRDLFDPAFKGKVGMLSEIRDTIELSLIGSGVAPANATEADVRRVHDLLVKQRDDGIVRSYYGQDYTDALAKGDLAITMAWSGDIAQLKEDNPSLEFVVPREGGLQWTDCLVIPKGAVHVEASHQFIDFVYRPQIAAQIAEYVGYVSPVPAAQQILKSEDPLMFPSGEIAARLFKHRNTTAEEDKLWNELFQDVSQA